MFGLVSVTPIYSACPSLPHENFLSLEYPIVGKGGFYTPAVCIGYSSTKHTNFVTINFRILVAQKVVP